MKPCTLPLAAALAVTSLPGLARAGEISVQLQPGPGANFAAQAGIPLSQLQSTLETELQALYRASDARRYLQAFGDAQAFSNRGLGADYAASPNTLMVGVAMNVSANADDEFVNDGQGRKPPIEGLGANLSFMAGTNLHWLGLSPVTIYANYFRGDVKYNEYDGTNNNFGLHGQIKLFRDGNLPDRSPVISWGGVDITSGIEKGHLTLNLTDNVKSKIPLTKQRNGPFIEANSAGLFKADMRVWSVPLEITTSFRLLYIVSVYGGLGFDWQFGNNKLTMDLNSQLLGVTPQVSNKVDVGSARLTANEEVAPSVGKLRSLVGVQLNMGFFRLFTHVNMLADRGLVGVVFGARLAF